MASPVATLSSGFRTIMMLQKSQFTLLIED